MDEQAGMQQVFLSPPESFHTSFIFNNLELFLSEWCACCLVAGAVVLLASRPCVNTSLWTKCHRCDSFKKASDIVIFLPTQVSKRLLWLPPSSSLLTAAMPSHLIEWLCMKVNGHPQASTGIIVDDDVHTFVLCRDSTASLWIKSYFHHLKTAPANVNPLFPFLW